LCQRDFFVVSQDTKQEILELHTDSACGSAYWSTFFKENKLTVDDVLQDPSLVPPMDTNALRNHPIDYFIPRKVLQKKQHLITGETSGFSGKPIVTAFGEQEFFNGFVKPFIDTAHQRGFPVNCNWLWAGPSGPHIIGKAVREILRYVGGLDPFSVDFDPRWYRKMKEGSLFRERYYKHLEEQFLSLLDTQHIEVIFSTPSVIEMLCAKMTEAERLRIRGVHYGGVSISYETYRKFQEAFPRAIHLAGYGNSLFGVFLEQSFDEEGIEYAVTSDRVEIDIVQEHATGIRICERGEEGRVMFSRFDETFMILNMVERDVARKTESGIKNPRPAEVFQLKEVLY